MKMHIGNTDIANFRQWYSLKSTIIRQLKRDTEVDTLAIPQFNRDGYTWQMVAIGNDYGWVAANYLIELAAPEQGPVPPPPPPTHVPNPTATKIKVGLHVASNPSILSIVDSAARLKAAGHPYGVITVIDNVELANKLAPFTTVMFRMVRVPELYNASILDGKTPEQAEALGYAFYFGQHHAINQQANGAQFLKLRNETGFHPLDGYFDLGIMKAADSEGRKVAICGDSMSSVSEAQWQLRLPALRYAKAHGHAVTLNAYGPYVGGKPGNVPVSADDGYIWYGGWPFRLYASVPEDARPLLIIGEAGASDSTVFRGADFVVNDMHGYNQKTVQYDYFIGFSYWSEGYWSSYPQSSLHPALPNIEALVMTL